MTVYEYKIKIDFYTEEGEKEFEEELRQLLHFGVRQYKTKNVSKIEVIEE